MTNIINFPRVYVASNDHVRHAFTADEILVQAGMSLYAVAGLLGHSTKQRAAMTQRYAHLQPAVDAQRAADILNGATR